MKRYGILYGTELDGNDTVLGSAKQLDGFIVNELSAKSAAVVKGTVKQKMMEFEPLAGYDIERNMDKPLAVRYTPLYMNGIRGLENIKGFSVLCVSGSEQRSGERSSSKFLMSTYFRTEELYKSDDFNYLDHIFGTRILNAADERAYLEKRKKINFAEKPRKVSPTETVCDLAVVMKAVDAIFNNQKVAIMIERDCAFQQRSIEILKLIYSYMPPILAAETGFSSYQNPKTLEAFADVNIMLFTIPKEHGLGDANVPCIIDLTEEQIAPDTPIARSVEMWSAIPWERRQVAMEAVFEHTEQNYDNGDIFVTKTEEFFKEYASFDNWIKSFDANSYINMSLEEIRQEMDSYGRWKRIPWAAETYYQKVAKANSKNLRIQTAEKYLTYYLSGEKDDVAKRLFNFGSNFVTPDLRVLSTKLCDHVAEEKNKEFSAQVVLMKKQHQEEVKQKDAKIQECNQAIESLKAQHIIVIDNLKIQHAAEVEELNAKHAAEIQAYKAKIDDLTERARRAIAVRDEKINELTVMLRQRDEEIQEIERRARTAESEKDDLQSRISELEDKIDRMEKRGIRDDKPEDPKKKWIMAGIGMAAGMLLIGLIWFLVALISGSSDAVEVTTPTVEIIETTIPTTAPTTAPTEPTTEATTVPTEPEPVEFMGWDDPALAEHMLISVDGVEQVAADDSWYADDIAIPEGYSVVAAISSEEEGAFIGYPDSYALILSIAQVGENENNIVDSEEAASNSGISNGESDTEPDETNTDGEYNSSTSDSEVDTEPTEEDNGWDNRNTESTTEATEEVVPVEPLTTEEWFALSDRIQLVIETENQVILSVGTDKMHEAAFHTAAWSAANEYIDIHITVRLEDGDLLDLTEGVRPLLRTKYGESYWWYVLEDFSTESSHMYQLQTVLNTRPCPILSFKYLGNEIVVLDYQGDVDKAAELEEVIDSAKAVGDIVFALAPRSNNSTEPSTEALDPTETSYNVGGMN